MVEALGLKPAEAEAYKQAAQSEATARLARGLSNDER